MRDIISAIIRGSRRTPLKRSRINPLPKNPSLYRRIRQQQQKAFALYGRWLRALGHKCNDRARIPLCRKFHHERGKDAHHAGTSTFWQKHNVDRWMLIRHHNERFKSEIDPNFEVLEVAA